MFKMNGLDLAHERVGRNGSVSWPYFVDVTHTGFSGDSCVRNSYLSPPKTHYRRVYHVVRCPIDAISVMVTHSWCSMRFIDSTLKLGMDGANQDDPRFWAKAWLEMNKFIENYAQQTFTLDNYTGLFQQVCRDSGLPDDKCLEASMPSRHHRNHETLTWEKLNAMVGTELTEAIRSAAVRYGFGDHCVDDQIRALKRKQELSGQQVVTHGIPGAECSEEAGQDCTDGLDWVWEASVADRMRRGGEASFREAWAGL
uniref:Uncharacterized protein n=1 Tax=Alexandrium catenella TaxID=2925 RepID=A0A7S1RNU6_ALECA|mmetsp:Transcript_64524/g.172093  ORF Transcript_64524/g.172093 Transcript_64524/m.172093 type:complete len:255 (+) Transcript_64524:137-901(+)